MMAEVRTNPVFLLLSLFFVWLLSSFFYFFFIDLNQYKQIKVIPVIFDVG